MIDFDCVRHDNCIKLSGKLNFESVPVIQKHLKNLFREKTNWIIDLSGINFSDSSGLALLVDCQRSAQKGHFQVQFKNMPKQMSKMAGVTGVSQMLSELPHE